jgi:hypothetical protein
MLLSLDIPSGSDPSFDFVLMKSYPKKDLIRSGIERNDSAFLVLDLNLLGSLFLLNKMIGFLIINCDSVSKREKNYSATIC